MPLGQQSLSAGEPWYASGTVWTVVGIVVAIVLGCWAVWAAFRSARPRRALYITVDQAVSLLRSAPGLEHRRIEVSLEGRRLTTPYVVTVDVVSDSALDIAPAMFGGAPLVLDFGMPILALLDKSSVPGRAGVREPAVRVESTALHVGPALLTPQHRLRYTVLIDGPPEFDAVADLVDVPLLELTDPWQAKRWDRTLYGALTLSLVCLVAAAWISSSMTVVFATIAFGTMCLLLTVLLTLRIKVAEWRLQRLR